MAKRKKATEKVEKIVETPVVETEVKEVEIEETPVVETSKESGKIKIELLCNVSGKKAYKKGEVVELEKEELDTFGDSFYKIV